MKNITHIVDSNGNEIRYAYPNSNSQKNLAGINSSYQNYLYSGNIGMVGWEMPLTKATLVKDPVHGTTQLKQTHYKYDAAGNMVQESEAYNGGYLNTYYTYDSCGNMLTKTDANGNKLCFKYDTKYQSAYLTEVTKADGTEIASFDYDFDTGNRIKATDPKGSVFGYEYDAIGRLTKEYLDNSDAKLGITRKITYDDLNNTVALKFGNVTAGWQEGLITYDKLFGKPTVLQRKVSGNLVTQKQFSYDSDGRLILEQDGEGHKTTYTYDALDRKTMVTLPLGSTTKYAYNDRTVTITDANGNVKVENYDLFDRLVSVKETPDSGKNNYTTSYTYDNFCDNSDDPKVYHLLQTINPKSAATIYTYDNLGRLIKTDYPQDTTNPMTAETFTYDSVGNLLTKTNGNGTKKLEYEFYAGYYLKQVTEPGGKIVSYTYDANDNPLTQITNGVAYNYTYDARNRVTSLRAQLDGYTFNVGYDYDAFGRITALSYPGRNAAVTYNYNELDLLQSIPGFVDSCSYDADNKLTTMALANGISNTYNYDQNDRPTKISVGNLLNLNYTYDQVGNITQINNDYYEYDGMNRLKWYGNQPYVQKATANGTEWSYDGAGNMTSKAMYLNGDWYTNASFSYDMANRLQAMGSTIYANDSAGARTGKSKTDETWSYLYDGESRLAQAIKNSVTQMQCVYDGAGMRYKKVENGKTTYYIYSGSNSLVEYTPADGKYTYRIYAGKQAVAEEKADVVKFYHKDHLGSTPLITDQSGNVLRSYDYEPYGAATNAVLFPEDGSFEKCSPTKINGEPQASNDVHRVEVGSRWCFAMHYSPADEYVEICNSDSAANRSKVGRLYDNGSSSWKAILSSGTIKLKSGKWYRISVKARAVTNLGTKKAAAYLSYNYSDSLNNKLVTKRVAWDASELAGGAWVRKYVIFQVPLECDYTTVAAFFYGHYGAGIVEYDDYVIEEFDSQPEGAPSDEECEFTGKRDGDSPSELYYFGARFYDPEVGRFITPDTYTNLPNDERNFFITADGSFMARSNDPGKYNQYAYCQNNPINRVDPDGHFVFVLAFTPEIIQAGIMGIGAVVATYENIKGMIEHARQEARSNTKHAEMGNIHPGDRTSGGRTMTGHAASQANLRGFNLEKIDKIIDNNKNNRVGKVDKEGKKTWEYTDKRGNKVVTNEKGDIVTVHGPAKNENGEYEPSSKEKSSDNDGNGNNDDK